jgi:hypothetical protein
MRKIITLILIVCFALVLALPLVSAASTYDSPSVETTLLSQDPDPIEPGQIVKVKFKIENEGKETNKDVIVKVTPKFPFSSYDGVVEKNIGKLQSSSTGADAVVVEFKLKVDEKAVEGDAELELVVLVGEGIGKSYTNDEFLINIQTHDAVLDITSITSNPKQIAPGESAEVNIMVKNLADSLLKDIKFKLDFSSDDLPLAPYQSSSERRISQLQSNYQNSLSFNIIADPEATPGLYKVPLNITYNDEKGNAYFVSDILAVTVGEIPKLKAYIKKSAVLQAKSEGKITLEVANSGSSNIKFLEITLLPSDDYQLVSTTNYFYMGDVDSDDTESEEVDIYINKKVETLHVPMLLKYTDANNKPFQQQFDLEMNLYSSSELKKFGLVESSSAGIYFLIIVLGIIGFILYRSYKKDPDKFSRRWKRRLSFRFRKKK